MYKHTIEFTLHQLYLVIHIYVLPFCSYANMFSSAEQRECDARGHERERGRRERCVLRVRDAAGERLHLRHGESESQTSQTW